MTTIVKSNQCDIELSSFIEIEDPHKRATLCHLLDMILSAAPELTVADLRYLMVQLTFAQQHPVALQSRLARQKGA